jgi:energy-coupling factor transporter ATP-binding protein EcfA2
LSEHLAASERLGEELLEALVASGVLDTQIEGVKEKRFQEYIEARAAEAQSRISERVRELQKQHEALIAEMGRLKQERDDKRAQVESEIRELRAHANADIEEERRRLDEQREALHREQETLATAVSQAAVRFSASRSELLSDLLTLVPALQAAGALQSSSVTQAAPPQEKLTAAVALPAPFTTSHDRARHRLDELEFFERFTRHVQTSGFRYRDTDLKAFHISVKCADLTVLTGLSGIGKSSLVRLYAEALAGEDSSARTRLLTVDVSPSWAEPQDILGNVNLLDRRFEPASCGLFNHLVAAAREHAQAGSHAGMVLIALDEMNLAQVEHYFAGFIQALERPAPRDIAVFDRSALGAEDPLREYARLPLPPTLRMIGTVNFDETTRPLSQRLKDRAAILELSGERHAGLQQLSRGDVPVVSGPAVLLADFQAWLGGEGQLPMEMATLLDNLNPLLLRIGAPITARRANAIRQLFAAASLLLSSEQVLDVAISTRVLPLLRGLDRHSTRQDATQILELLAAAPGGCRDSCQRLSSMIAQEQDEWQEVLEDE